MTDETKTCKDCQQTKPVSEYWTSRAGTQQYHSRCKKCHVTKRRQYAYNRKPRVKKLRGFEALDDATKEGILEMMNSESKVKKKDIAAKYHIPYPTYCQWCQKGWVK